MKKDDKFYFGTIPSTDGISILNKKLNDALEQALEAEKKSIEMESRLTKLELSSKARIEEMEQKLRLKSDALNDAKKQLQDKNRDIESITYKYKELQAKMDEEAKLNQDLTEKLKQERTKAEHREFRPKATYNNSPDRNNTPKSEYTSSSKTPRNFSKTYSNSSNETFKQSHNQRNQYAHSNPSAPRTPQTPHPQHSHYNQSAPHTPNTPFSSFSEPKLSTNEARKQVKTQKIAMQIREIDLIISPEQRKRAFKELVRKWHPDRNREDPDADEMSQFITHEYRQRYP